MRPFVPWVSPTGAADSPFLGHAAVPRLGLGLAALGRPGYINLGRGSDLVGGRGVEDMRARCWEVLDAAWARGVR